MSAIALGTRATSSLTPCGAQLDEVAPGLEELSEPSPAGHRLL